MKQTVELKNQDQDLKSVESYGGTSNYNYQKPEVIRDGSVPVLIAGGWSEGTQALQDTAEVVLGDGREVITVDHTRTGEVDDHSEGLILDQARSNGISEYMDSAHPETIQRAETLMAVLDDAGLDQVDVIAHSEGAIDIELAARLHPDRFRNIILVAPAGMMGKDSTPRLLSRFARKVVRGYVVDMREIKERSAESAAIFAKNGPEYFAANRRKAWREIGATASGRIDKNLPKLREKGIGIGLLVSHSDRGFPDKRINKQVSVDGPAANVDVYASVAAKRAGHDDIVIHPERSTGAALQMLAELES